MNVLYSHLEGEYRKEPHVNKCALMILKKKTNNFEVLLNWFMTAFSLHIYSFALL